MLTLNDIEYLNLLTTTKRFEKYIDSITTSVFPSGVLLLTLELTNKELENVVATTYTFSNKSQYLRKYVDYLVKIDRSELALLLEMNL